MLFNVKSFFVALVAIIAGMNAASAVPTNLTTSSAESATLEPLARAAPFGINVGVDHAHSNVVAWVAGQSQCKNVILGPVSSIFSIPSSPPYSEHLFYHRSGPTSAGDLSISTASRASPLRAAVVRLASIRMGNSSPLVRVSASLTTVVWVRCGTVSEKPIS